MSQAVQPYSYLSINENNSDRAYELVWLRPLDRTVPMAVLPPYAHGVSTRRNTVSIGRQYGHRNRPVEGSQPDEFIGSIGVVLVDGKVTVGLNSLTHSEDRIPTKVLMGSTKQVSFGCIQTTLAW